MPFCPSFWSKSKAFFVLISAISILSTSNLVMAADYVLIRHSMVYNVDAGKDEYTALILSKIDKSIRRCKATYELISNKLSSEKCSAAGSIPFSIPFSGTSDVHSTIVFNRVANRQNNTVLGPDGIWNLDEKNGELEFCVFGDITAKCVSFLKK